MVVVCNPQCVARGSLNEFYGERVTIIAIYELFKFFSQLKIRVLKNIHFY
jgi:hypothetical protein